MKDSSTQAGESQILSLTSVNKSVNSSSSSTDDRSTLSGPTFAGSLVVTAPKPATSTNTKSRAAIFLDRSWRSSPKKGNLKREATGCLRGQMIQSYFIIDSGRWRTWTLLHLRPPHTFVAFHQENKIGGNLPKNAKNKNESSDL